MSREERQLAIVATICFFPTALVGWLLYSNYSQQAMKFFRLSVFIFLFILLVAGIIVVVEGGKLIKPMGSFF